MTLTTNTVSGQVSNLAKLDKTCTAAPKWVAIINDTAIPMPDKVIRAEVLREQAGIADEMDLIRDHNDEHDAIMPQTGNINLGMGNVFYTEPKCDASDRPVCEALPKLAYTVNDHWEIVLRPQQTGKTLRDLFGLSDDVELLRDRHSPDDQVIKDGDSAEFGDGCVFRTRKVVHQLTIIVNKVRFSEADGVKPRMTGLEIAALVEKDQAKNCTVEEIKPKAVNIPLTEEIAIENCQEFKVIRGNINAGFQSDRLARELELLRVGGASVTLVTEAAGAVIYHDVPVRGDLPIKTTDVLVKIPAGYPSGIIDNAFLPSDSPIMTLIPGAPQQVEIIAGRSWRQKSIHPHAGAGIAWDKNRHGFHTYFSEVQNWLHARS